MAEVPDAGPGAWAQWEAQFTDQDHSNDSTGTEDLTMSAERINVLNLPHDQFVKALTEAARILRSQNNNPY